ncbi:hypothetical protein [Mobilicoccus pelagius]|uniref:Uncharacterized protein n=1 Tax=Mobilicoccus pelagius NBRC 104925 TaxID=1089455 RepID=H5UMG2_9MICO|nr:hypothetical protein [Mobilicoccus pelagius]GAB46920.1 hypothetical protein MOPEL_001_00380 [Mobilicoccus pelagius NBRC 104925]
MTTPLTDDERRIVTILAFASREFDRARDLLLGDDEPGEQEVAAGVEADPKTEEEHKGAARKVLSAAGAVVGVAGRLALGSVHPRAKGWDTASLDDRIDWWTKRFGTAAAALAAVPGLGGKIGKMVGVGDVVGAAAQILVVNAVARETGRDDVSDRVAAAARIVLGHDLDPAAVDAVVDAPEAQPEPEVPGEAAEEKAGILGRVGRTGALVWRVATRIKGVRADLDERQQGGFLSRAVSNLPGVGALGAFVSERSGISQAADKAREEFAA